jgi:hypothetical protein
VKDIVTREIDPRRHREHLVDGIRTRGIPQPLDLSGVLNIATPLITIEHGDGNPSDLKKAADQIVGIHTDTAVL